RLHCLALSPAVQWKSPHPPFFLAVLLLVLPIPPNQKLYLRPPPATDPARLVYEQLIATRPSMPRSGRVLFLSDPFDPADYTLTFLFRLHYRDKEIQVDRVKVLGAEPNGEARKSYQHIFTF